MMCDRVVGQAHGIRMSAAVAPVEAVHKFRLYILANDLGKSGPTLCPLLGRPRVVGGK
jgi:hypothetical protein